MNSTDLDDLPDHPIDLAHPGSDEPGCPCPKYAGDGTEDLRDPSCPIHGLPRMVPHHTVSETGGLQLNWTLTMMSEGTDTSAPRPHLIDGEFQSDKYPTTPRGKVPLSVKDPTAQDLLWEYAQRRRAVDAEFSEDLETALRKAGYRLNAERRTCPEKIKTAGEDLSCSLNVDHLPPHCPECTGAACDVKRAEPCCYSSAMAPNQHSIDCRERMRLEKELAKLGPPIDHSASISK